LLSIENGYSKSGPNLLVHLNETIYRLQADLTLVWILAHVGLKSNEEADSLAKIATKSHSIDINIKRELDDIYHLAGKYCTDK